MAFNKIIILVLVAFLSIPYNDVCADLYKNKKEFLGSSCANCKDSKDHSNLHIHKKWQRYPEEGISKYFLTYGYQRNYPYSYKLRYGLGIPHPNVGFRYYMNQNWLAGITGGFKFIVEKDTNLELAILTITQDGGYLYRLFHPFYLMLSEQIIYLCPTKKGMFPLQRVSGYGIEIGVGVALGFLWKASDVEHIELTLRRWRGTKTRRIQSLEFYLGFGLKL